ncbi:hypothetical protein RCL1_004751 [Eukaryota sp. TZLM3-RCL]
MSIVYSLVARSKTLLAEYTDRSVKSGNFKLVALRILERVEAERTHRASFQHDGFTFHVLVDQGYTFLAMATSDMKNRRPFAFLDDIKSRWFATYGQRVTVPKPYEMQADFSQILQRQGEYFTNSSTDSLARISKDLSDLQTVCYSNIEKILERGERVELLVDRSEGLSNTARAFNKRSLSVRKQMWWSNVKSMIMVIVFCLALLYIIVAQFCGWGMGKCFKK